MSGFFNDAQAIVAGMSNVTGVHVTGFDATAQRPLFVTPPLTAGVKGIEIVDIVILSDTSTTGSDGSNNYAFQVKDKTNTKDLLATAVNTNGNELTADTAFHITPDQENINLGVDTVLELDITETGTATKLADAEIAAFVIWKFEV